MRWLSKGRTYYIKTKKMPQEIIRKLKSETASSCTRADADNRHFVGTVNDDSFDLRLVGKENGERGRLRIKGAPRLKGGIITNGNATTVEVKECSDKIITTLFLIWTVMIIGILVITSTRISSFLEIAFDFIIVPYLGFLIFENFLSNESEKVLRDFLGDSK